MPAIPKIIHQTWRDAQIPPHLVPLQQSWRRRNPGWDYVFWTDADIAAFIRAHHPALLPLFAGYARPICRVDLARYLILRHFGGIYADLDCDCLKPIEGLIGEAGLAIGIEPDAHLALEKAVRRGLRRILCPSFIAAVPGHAFWDHLLDHLQAARGEPDPLDATGPFALTRAFETYDGAAAVTLLPAPLIYPVSKQDCWNGQVFDLVFWERATRDAYVLHYWDGSWFGGPPQGRPQLPRNIPVEVHGERSATPPAAGRPLISCLMVTRDRAARARLAIECFLAQTYPERELVIVADGRESELEAFLAELGRPEIRLIHLPEGGRTLGELRNIAVDEARGTYVSQWDDDDLYDPQRLEVQHRILQHTGSRAAFLQRWMMWWPAENRLVVTRPRLWEGSILAERAAMPRYPALRHGEDTPVAAELKRRVRVVSIDLPRLYTYVVHGGNTFGAVHFEEHWQRATARFSGARCTAVLEEMGRRLPIEAYRRLGTSDSVRPARPAASTAGGAIARFGVSIVLCTYRRPELLADCLRSLATQRNPYGGIELLVVDNDLRRSAEPVFTALAPALTEGGLACRYLAEERTGVAFARNLGLAEAGQDVVAFIDDDEQALPHWLERLLQPLAGLGGEVDIVAGEVEPDFGESERPAWLTDALLPAFSCGWGWGDQPRFLKAGEWFGEGNCAFRRVLFAERRFDTALGRRGDDLMCMEGTVFTALRHAGAAAYYRPDAIVSHRVHADRLNKRWLLRRMFYQGVSDYIGKRSTGEAYEVPAVVIELDKLANRDLDRVDGIGLSTLMSAYYQAGFALGSNMV